MSGVEEVGIYNAVVIGKLDGWCLLVMEIHLPVSRRVKSRVG